MAQEVEIRRETELPFAPEQVWDAVATGAGNRGWLFPMEIEPWVGGMVTRGPSMVTVWDPPRHYASRYQGDDGFSADLEYLIEARDGRTSVLRSLIRWVNPGTVDDRWADRTEAAERACDFYYHTLRQYLQYFGGRPAVYLEADHPASATDANAFTVLRRGLGLDDEVAQGDTVRLALPRLDRLDVGVEQEVEVKVDYLTAHFIGLRSSDALYCFLGRNAWGWPIGLRLHLFADDVDQEKTEQLWHSWLDELLT